jgi:hypothetical protein
MLSPGRSRLFMPVSHKDADAWCASTDEAVGFLGEWNEHHSVAGCRRIADRPCRHACCSPHGIVEKNQDLG